MRTFIFPVYRGGNESTSNLSNISKITQVKGKILTTAVWLQAPYS